jgi:hypothetical protein
MVFLPFTDQLANGSETGSNGDGRRKRCLQQQGRELVGHVEHHIMPACKLLLPPAALSCLGVKLPEGTVKAARQNVSDVRDVVAGAAGPQVAPELGQNVAPCVGGALVRR